jgi:NAD+ synthetase
MRIALAQLNPTVGDVAGNTRLVLDAMDAARRDRADILVTSELALIGYPPRDLLLREGVVDSCEAAVRQIAARAGPMLVAVGHPRHSPPAEKSQRPFRNAVSLCRDGEIILQYDKRLLPGYDVFDEDRYFFPGRKPGLIEHDGRRLGICICEDIWRAGDVRTDNSYPVDPVAELAALRPDVILCLNGSPFVLGKFSRHIEQLALVARQCNAAIVSINQVGGNDDLIFDGRSVIVNARGEVTLALPGWRSAVETCDLEPLTPGAGNRSTSSPARTDPDSPPRELFHALVLGVQDYCRKTRHERVLLGLSGGIDSALTATIAAAALSSPNVQGVFMPSRFTAPISREDATALAERLAMPPCIEIPISAMHRTILEEIGRGSGEELVGVADENIQARLRGLTLMALANERNALVLATGNKSELATGYCTLYGDMCGAIAVLGDLLKTRVYELARWINDHHHECGFNAPPIPQRSITRPPTAELRPNQTDQDTLPPYDVLDLIIERFIDREQSVARIVRETGIDEALVASTVRTIDRQQFKRDQAAVVLKVTPRAFGRGRPMPIVMKQTDFVVPSDEGASKPRSRPARARSNDRS